MDGSRITEAGDARVTEASDQRITENFVPDTVVTVPLKSFDLGGGYQPNGIDLATSSDYAEKTSDLTDNIDSTDVTVSCWFKIPSIAGLQYILDSGADPGKGFRIREGVVVDGEIAIRGRDTSDVIVLDIRTSSTYDDDEWHNLLFSSNGTTAHLYIDNVSDISTSTLTNTAIDFTQTLHRVGIRGDDAQPLLGSLADLWVDYGTYIDFSSSGNRAAFYKADLGANGENPTGTSPIMFFSGDASTWHTNKGTGGGFTKNGSIVNSATDPPVGFPIPAVGTGTIITSPVNAFSITGLVPGAGTGVIVLPPAGAYTLTGFVGDVTADITVFAALGSFTLAGLVPESAGAEVSFDIPLGTFSLAGTAPEILARAWSEQIEDTATWTLATEAGGSWTVQGEDSATWIAVDEDTATWTTVPEDTAGWS